MFLSTFYMQFKKNNFNRFLQKLHIFLQSAFLSVSIKLVDIVSGRMI